MYDRPGQGLCDISVRGRVKEIAAGGRVFALERCTGRSEDTVDEDISVKEVKRGKDSYTDLYHEYSSIIVEFEPHSPSWYSSSSVFHFRFRPQSIPEYRAQGINYGTVCKILALHLPQSTLPHPSKIDVPRECTIGWIRCTQSLPDS
jgi:hypothetical protein